MPEGGLFLGLFAAQMQVSRGLGFDASKNAFTSAQRMLSRLPDGHGRKACRLDVAERRPEGMFDVVGILDVMHHIPPDAQLTVLDMATEKVSPGERILYKDMSNRPMWMAYANRLHDLMIAREWIHYLPLDKIKERLEQKGFRKLSSERIARYCDLHEILVMEREMT
jgi:2-polyprenyl-3-methyl-5-hydroxy-6-metoxy-1,4-benzoquinol methylase